MKQTKNIEKKLRIEQTNNPYLVVDLRKLQETQRHNKI